MPHVPLSPLAWLTKPAVPTRLSFCPPHGSHPEDSASVSSNAGADRLHSQDSTPASAGCSRPLPLPELGRQWWKQPNTSSNPLPPRSALLAWATAPLTALILFAPTPPAWARTTICYGLDQISSRCTTISLPNRNLSSLPEGIFRGLNNLERLWLDHNNLRSLPEGIFRGLNNLERLSL